MAALLDLAVVPRSTYYYYLKKQAKTDKYKDIKIAIQKVYAKHKGRYGYRRITTELNKLGYKLDGKTVLRLMHACNIKCQVRLRKYRSYRGEAGTIAPNLLERNFKADKPNQKWVTDVTEFKLFGTKLFLSPIMDLFNGEIISYNISQKPNFQQTTDMLDKAFRKIPKDTNLILHSDQGWQYRLAKYHERLKKKGIVQSMSRKGNCYDNAAMENFFGLLKSELFYLQKFKSIDHFTKELITYIHYYNNERIKQKLRGLSPIKYRKQFLLVA